MSKYCFVTFDQSEHGTYFTGQVISGKVVVNLNKAKRLKAIKLEICGYASAQWRVKRRGRTQAIHATKRNRKHLFHGREDYIASTTYLVGSEHSQNVTIEPGAYTYTFACPIPTHCPSSFEGSYGHIRYLARVTFMRVGSSHRTLNVGFTVLKLLDLNVESKLLRQPASVDAVEYFCFMHAKPVQLQMSLPQTGYVPGQLMLVNARVINNSNTDCKKLLIMLYLRASYTAEMPSLRTTTEKILLVKKECGAVAHFTEKNYTETLRIPATAPTCEHLSKIVRISYEVSVVAVMNWLMANPKAKVPITIGNVPLATAIHNEAGEGPLPSPATPSINELWHEQPSTSAMAAQLGNLEDYVLPDEDEGDTEDEHLNELPPPTYEEAMFMTTDIADTDVNIVSEATRFTPRYPVFDVDNFQSPAPNPPQKRRRRRRRRTAEQQDKILPGKESPIEI